MSREAPRNPLHERYASREMAAIFSSPPPLCDLAAALDPARRMPARARPADPRGADRGAPRSGAAPRPRPRRRDRAPDPARRRRPPASLRRAGEAEAGGILHLGATSAFITDNTDQLLAARSARAPRRSRHRDGDPRPGRFRAPPSRPPLPRLHPLPAGAAHDGRQARLPLGTGPRPRPRGAPPPALDAALPRRQGDDRHPGELPDPVRRRPRQGARARPAVAGAARLRRLGADLRPDLHAQARQPAARRARRRRRELPQAGHRPAAAAGGGRARRAVRRHAGRLVGDGLQAQSRAGRTDVRPGAPHPDRRRSTDRSTPPPSGSSAASTTRPTAGWCCPTPSWPPTPSCRSPAILRPASRVNGGAVAARVDRELPFMATETLLMQAVLRGGDRQHLHEKIRKYSFEAQDMVARWPEQPTTWYNCR